LATCTLAKVQVVPEMLLQVSTVYVGALNAGVLALGDSLVVMVPPSLATFV
jgi:hypothetical protein